MDGRALTANELAFAARVSPQTASFHLAQLTGADLLAAEKQGHNRYFRLASPLVARMLESVMAVAGPKAKPLPAWRGGEALRTTRTCYDHLAGRLGVALAEALSAAGHVALSPDGGEVTERGHAFLPGFGAEPAQGRRVFCRPCLDWSERRPHIAGRLAVWTWAGSSVSATRAPLRSRLMGPAALPKPSAYICRIERHWGTRYWGASVARCPPNRAYRLCSDGERLIIVGTCDLTR